jgi:hypothetical protein
MKAVLEFNLPEEQQEFTHATKAIDYYIALEEIRNEVFRPARKHGYSSPLIEKAIEQRDPIMVINLLEDLFSEILGERNIQDV